MGKLLATSHFLLISILISVSYAAESEQDPLKLPPLSLLQKTESIRFKDLSDPFVLKHWPPIRDSEHITINGVKLTKNLDYLIDYGTGTVTFLKDYPPETTVQITYRALPFAIKKGYKRDLFRQDQPLEQPPSEVKLESRADLTPTASTGVSAAASAGDRNADIRRLGRQQEIAVPGARLAN